MSQRQLHPAATYWLPFSTNLYLDFHCLLCSMTKLKEHSREICYPAAGVTLQRPQFLRWAMICCFKSVRGWWCLKKYEMRYGLYIADNYGLLCALCSHHPTMHPFFHCMKWIRWEISSQGEKFSSASRVNSGSVFENSLYHETVSFTKPPQSRDAKNQTFISSSGKFIREETLSKCK